MFTDEEIEAAALRYLTSEVVTGRSEAGIRDITAIKRQVYEIIAAAFMLRPAAVFSVCWMASNALFAEIGEQLADVRAIRAAAPRVSKASQRVSSVTDLRNAEASLVTLTAAFSARSSGVAGGIGPGVQRFSASVERFMRSELVKNVVDGADIVETGEELQALVAARWEEAWPRHARIAAGLTRFVEALGAYESVRLPDSVVGSLLARIQARLAVLTADMEGAAAPALSREAMLELFAMRTLLRQAAQFRPPVRKKAPLTGDAASGTLVGGSGASASILGTVSGPFDYDPGAVLRYRVGAETRDVPLPGTGVQVSADDVRAALAVDGRLVVEVVQTSWPAFVGRRSSVVGDEGVLLHHVAAGEALSANGTHVAVASVNVEVLGVEPGMQLVLPDAGVALAIVGVDATALTLEAPLVAGSYAYYIGPDYRALPAGAAVYLSGGDTGTRHLHAGRIAALELSFDLATAEPVRAQVLDERIRVAVRTPDVGAPGALLIEDGEGASALGLAGLGVSRVDRFDTRVDLTARGVVPGDLIWLQHGDRTITSHVIGAIAGTVAQVSPPVLSESGSIHYLIDDARVRDYEVLCAGLRPLMVGEVFSDATALDVAMGRLSRGARYAGHLEALLTGYEAALSAMQALLGAYVVPRDPTVEQAVRVMTEHGFDRAVDLFLALRLPEFFALDADGVSYKTWVIRTAAEVARQVVPVSKDTRDPTSGWRTIAVQPTTNDVDPTR